MMQAVADRFGNRRLARNARELLLKPGFERLHERLALVLAYRMARVSTVPTDCLLDRIELRDSLKSFARDRCVAALGNIEEVAPKMAPAESKRDRCARCRISKGLVRGISIALHDPAVVVEQLERVYGAAPGSVAVCNSRRVRSAPLPVV